MRGVLAVCAAGWLVLPLPVKAQQTQQQTAHPVIELREGGVTTVTMERPFTSATVANPEITDALPRSDRILVLVGKKVGSSDLVIFSDSDKLYHATVVVVPPAIAGKVFNHNQKSLSDYRAYQCNPVCTRTDDKFEQKDVIILGGGLPGPTTIGAGGVNVIVPPR